MTQDALRQRLPRHVIVVPMMMLFFGATAQAQEETKVSGTVIDAAGQPAAGVRVAPYWDGGHGMLPTGGTQTGDTGRFSVTVEFNERPQVLLAIDKDERLGGLVTVEPQTAAEPVSIRLGSLVSVHGKFTCNELGHPPPWTNVYVAAMPGDIRILQCDSSRAEFAFKLPPGKYSFFGYGTDVLGVTRELELTADRPDLDLGALELRASPIALHRGKTPPAWNVTDARGVPPTAQLSDYKGKWVLLEFWGFW